MLTPIKSIRAFCVGCSGGNRSEVKHCPVVDCPLFPYRMGKRPKTGEDSTQEADEENTQESR